MAMSVTSTTKPKFKGALIDLDGTVFFKSQAIAGAREALETLRQAGIRLRFLSNTDSITSSSLARQVAKFGIGLEDDEVFTAASAALEFLKGNRGKKCFCLLSEDLKSAFKGFAANTEDQADYVVIGDCRGTVSYDLLNHAFQHLMRGAQLIALQRGRYFIKDNGYNLDTGAFVALLEYAAGTTAKVLGKPSREFFSGALAGMGLAPGDAIIIGDDLETDIRGASQMGMSSILVRTGKFTKDALLGSNLKPTWVVDSLADVPEVLFHSAS